MRRVRAVLDVEGQHGVAVGTQATREALEGAVDAFVQAFAGGTAHEDEVVACLLDRAACLLGTVADTWPLHSADGPPRQRVAAGLATRLESIESAVLEAEITYEIGVSDISGPAKQVAHALERLASATNSAYGVHLGLQSGVAEIAALLVRVAANVNATGRAGDGAVAGSQSLSFTLDRLVEEIAVTAEQLPGGRRSESPGDQAGRFLCESLRVPVDVSALASLSSDAPPAAHQHALETGRRAWMALAARHFAVASQLEDELPELWYQREFGSLPRAVSMGAANLVCGGRLLSRADQFRHRSAWGRQGLALSHAIEAYVLGLRGEEQGYVQAQLIVMTRLLRATAALATIDAQLQNITHGCNGRSLP